MTQTALIQKVSGQIVPFTPEDEEFFGELKENQVTTWALKSKGARKQRSFQQLKLLMAAIRVVVHNTDHPNWNTVDRAKLSLKVALNYIDQNSAVVAPDGHVILNYRSFGFEHLGHMEACRLFDRAFPQLAYVIGVSEDELIQAAKEKRY